MLRLMLIVVRPSVAVLRLLSGLESVQLTRAGHTEWMDMQMLALVQDSGITLHNWHNWGKNCNKTKRIGLN